MRKVLQSDFAHYETLGAHSEFDQTLLALAYLLHNLVLPDESPTLGVWHEAFGTEHSGVLLEGRQMLLRANNLVERHLSVGDCREYCVASNEVSPNFEQVGVELVCGEDTDFDGLASPSWQHASASDHLVSLGRVDVELDDGLDALFELPFL